MKRRKRRNVTISPDALTKLEQEADERGVPVAQIIDERIEGRVHGIEPDDGVALSE